MTVCFCSLASTNLLLSCLFSFGNVFEVNTLSREVASGRVVFDTETQLRASTPQVLGSLWKSAILTKRL